MTSILTLSARAALQWRLLLLWAACVLLPTLLLAMPVYSLLAGQLDYSTHAPALAHALDIVALADLTTVLGRQMAAIGTAGFGALALTLALSPLVSGAAIAAARAPERLRFKGLLAGAVAEYPRMVRMLCWAAVPLGVAGLFSIWLLDMAKAHGRTVVLPEDARNAMLAAGVAAALVVLFVNLTLDAGRAVLATDRRRTSAIGGWWRGLRLLVGRPGPVLGAYALFTVIGLLLAALLALGRLQVPPVGPVQLIAALLLTQLIALVIGWMRVARLFALVRVALMAR